MYDFDMRFLKPIIVLGLFFCLTQFANAKSLYSKSYGNPAHPALIFLHGGPGYNSFTFEHGVAKTLAQQGFYVLVYDRRGSGRSLETRDNQYTFAEATEDISALLNHYDLKQASLLGHSFGGHLALRFTQRYPERVQNVVLTGVPLSFPLMYQRIHTHCRQVYAQTDNKQGTAYLNTLVNMPSDSLNYSAYSFMHAMQCGVYTPAQPTAEAKAIYGKLLRHSDSRYVRFSTQAPVKGFFEQEHYTTQDLTPVLKELVKTKPVYALLGKEDGLFNAGDFDTYAAILGKERVSVISGASHNAFIDQKNAFVQQLKSYLSPHHALK